MYSGLVARNVLVCVCPSVPRSASVLTPSEKSSVNINSNSLGAVQWA